MNKPVNFFTNDNIVIRILMFLIAIFIMVSLLPFKNKFKYEYQEGSKWNHENLYAPFDFAIMKNQKDIEREKDSVLGDFKPYFKVDKGVYLTAFDGMKQKFENTWKDYLVNNLHFNSNYQDYYTNNLRSKYFKIASDILDDVYGKGIISIPRFLKKGYSRSFPFVLENNNMSIENDSSNVLTENNTGEYLRSAITRHLAKDSASMNIDRIFFDKLNLSKFIHSNILYDSETSSNIKKEMLNSISLTKGLVQSGEKIITRNEVVDRNKYIILQSLKNEYETANVSTLDTVLILLGHLFLISTALLVIYLFLFHFRKDILRNNLKISFILSLVLICIICATISIHVERLNLYIIPFAILPIIIRTFYDTRLALFVHIVTMLIIGLIAPNGFEFVFLQIITGMIAIFSLASVRRRNQIFLSALLIFFTYSLVYFCISIIYNGGAENIYWNNYLWFLANCFLLLMSYPLIYIFERIFGFLSDVTLLELGDTNRPLLRLLEEKAPGTFQHCLVVANLCEETIYKIGGDPLLVRAGALYHDIGKMDIPYFFIENQVMGFNPHDEIDFEKSAEIIISHVEHGVKIAKKYGIPEPIIDFIRTHHGNSKVQYFYKSFIKKYPESEVEIDKFTYPGPIPFSKETSVLMMADSVEAASRSLKVINEETISDLVENIINYQVSENQHSDANLTFKDVSIIKKILKKKLKNIYHERIQYPK